MIGCYYGGDIPGRAPPRRDHQLEKVIKAAQTVCDRWDSHDGVSDEHIEKLRKALEEARK